MRASLVAAVLVLTACVSGCMATPQPAGTYSITLYSGTCQVGYWAGVKEYTNHGDGRISFKDPDGGYIELRGTWVIGKAGPAEVE